MDIDEILLDTEDRMIKCVADYDAHLKSVRSGQATTEILEHVQVEIAAYGTISSLKTLGLIAKGDARMLTVKPFDVKTIKEIDKAIQLANIGATVNNDGKILRVNFPPLSEETRRKQTKLIKDRLEQHKITMRSARHDGIKGLKDAEKEGAPEDAVKKATEEINDLTKKYEAHLEAHYEKKVKELMTV